MWIENDVRDAQPLPGTRIALFRGPRVRSTTLASLFAKIQKLTCTPLARAGFSIRTAWFISQATFESSVSCELTDALAVSPLSQAGLNE